MVTDYKRDSVGLLDLNYPFLQQQGLSYLKQLAGKIWTDYHEHDPGISILEVLCFAIIDLEYRTNFPIEDLLQPSPNQSYKEELKHFYHAEEIMPCNPLTADDFLKLVLDVPGVINAKVLVHDSPEEIQGGYHILVDFDKRVLQNSQEKQLLERVKQRLYQHRNLCEDFFSIEALKPLYFQTNASIELEEDIRQEEGEKFIAEIFFTMQSFLTPYIKFHSLRTMLLRKNKSVDEVFTGPLLNQGFIDEEELEARGIRPQIYVSELLKQITSIKQVNSVNKFSINLVEQENEANKMVLDIPIDRVPKLSIEHSKISLYQKGSLLPINPDKVKQWYDELINSRVYKRPYLTEEKIATRKGRFRNLAFHPSIQNDFPLIFGVGKEGLTASVSQERKAQARQLKGYLMFFDQLFANYLAQLAHVKDLMAVNNQMNEGYFTQLPEKVPGLINLLKTANLIEEEVDRPFKVQRKYLGIGLSKLKSKQDQEQLGVEERYLYYLHKILKTNTDYSSQKNKMLDHLLARFAESFAGDLKQLDKSLPEDRSKKLAYDKALLLQDYVAISRDRSKAVDLSNAQNHGWDSDNISGFMRQLCRYLGIKNLKRRFLYEILKSSFYLEKSFAQQSFELFLGENLQDKYDNLLILQGNFPKIKELAIRYGVEISNYEIVEKLDNQFGIILYIDQQKKQFIEFINNNELALNSYDQARGIIKQATSFFKKFNDESEGFHLVEHILLRTSTKLEGANDPYSFKMTLVIPSWPARFQSEGFKNLLHEFIMLKSPAHVLVNVLWLDLVEMESFEKAFKEWIYYKTTVDSEDPRLKQAARHLLGLIMLYSQEE